jgi:hypothetical protein
MEKRMSEEYKDKLVAFMEGLEIPDIDEAIEESPEYLKALGELMAERTKQLHVLGYIPANP